MRHMMLLTMTLAGGIVAGCGNKADSGALMKGAAQDYDAQNYSAAQHKAEQAMGTSRPPQSEQAAYLAGMSAYKRGLPAQAEAHFRAAEQSTDSEISGKAKGMLGIIRMDQHQPAQAAQYFADASLRLEGDDAAQAAQRAADAYERAGDSSSAARWREKAGLHGADSGPVVMGGTGGASTGQPVPYSTAVFTLQAGAFAQRARAEKAAADCRHLAQRFGLGEVRIIDGVDPRGRPLHLVQFGTFRTRSEAAGARSKIGKLEYIVAAASPM